MEERNQYWQNNIRQDLITIQLLPNLHPGKYYILQIRNYKM